jgi:parvulin-like peptidyl-prolyl isomerase
VWEELVEGVHVPEEQVRAYYEAHRDDLAVGEEVRLGIIAVRSRAEADEILAALAKGENFGRLAYERSLGKLAARGGDTGWVDFRTLPALIQQAVVRLQPGDVAGPLEKAEAEFLLVGLRERHPLRAASLEEARPEIERRLLREMQQEAVRAWLAEQESISEVEVLISPESPGGEEPPS